ncbi:MAG: sugar ABC transporter permease YjfF [Verrucomicrobia subdivision 3 bacterium]|nr:sugar ABC transporter permease YjfF [Limisphaerales bacterium]
MNLRLLKRNIPFLATATVCILLYLAAGFRYENFFSIRVFLNFISENAVLGVAAVGMTMVILSGGIDLSVGSVVGVVSISMALLIEKHGVPASAAIPLMLISGGLFGAGMGALIHFYSLPPFLVTLAGMFFARGLGFVLQLESMPITRQVSDIVSALTIPLGPEYELAATSLIFISLLVVAMLVVHFTPFGRNVYAIGGNEPSSLLMGLPIAATKIGVYAASGFCSALAGVVYTFYTTSGNPTAGVGLELEAIAAAVIGGTLLSGGVGYLAGTLLGVLIFAMIQTIVIFENINSWWTKIIVGLLLLVFILLQKLIQAKKA